MSARPAALADCCPRCVLADIFTTALPLDVTPEDIGSLRASYCCTTCGHRWNCWWDADSAGQPMPRSAAA